MFAEDIIYLYVHLDTFSSCRLSHKDDPDLPSLWYFANCWIQ